MALNSTTLIVGDLHAKANNIETVDKVLTQCKKLALKCTRTVFMGDQVDTKGVIQSAVARLFVKHFQQWPGRVIMLVGNHDKDNVQGSTRYHSLEFLKLLKNVSIIESPSLDREFKELFLPYMTDETLARQVDILRTYGHLYNRIFIHNSTMGAVYGNGRGVQSNVNLQNIQCPIIAGHIHLHQTVGNVTYVGTPYTTSFGESDQEKHVALMDNHSGYLEYVKLEGIPQHRTVRIEVADQDDLNNLRIMARKDDLVRVVITKPHNLNLDTSVLKDRAAKIIIQNKRENLRLVQEEIAQVSSSVLHTTTDAIDKSNVDSINKENLHTKNKDIIKEVQDE